MTEQTDIEWEVQQLAASPDNRCFACGPGNPRGLHLHFRREGEVAAAEFCPEQWQHGWAGVVHGGILATVLDEAMAYAMFFAGTRGMTARMEVRYRAAVHSGDRLRVEARVVRDLPKIADIEGRICRAGQVVAEANGRFMKLGRISPDMMLG